MYRIYCDNSLIYHQNIEELKITNATVDLEQNEIGTFKFTIYPTNPYINSIRKMNSIIRVYQDDYLLFRGMACEDNIAFKNQKTIQCKQEYYFLTFSVQRPYEFKGTPQELFTQLINVHNSQVEEAHQFKVGEVTVTDPNDYITRSDSTYLNTWDSITKKLIDGLGGYLRIRHEKDGNYIDYLKDFTTRSAQEITFGENMLDVKRETSGLDIATVLIPLGAKIEGEDTKRVDITSVNDGKDYVEDTEAIERYGRIVVTQTWDDVTEPSNLLRKARESLSSKVFQITGITISALDMAHIDKDITNFQMHNYIKVNSAFHGINDYYLPLKMSINLFVPQNNKISLNTTRKSLTDSQIDESNKYDNVIEVVEKIESDYEVNIPKIESDIEEIKNKRQYRLQIVSSQGNIFKNGDIETTLSAVLYEWDNVATDNYNDNQFIWTRASNDEEADAIWNQVHASGQKSINITNEDVHVRATFFCDFIDPVTRKSLLE